jgi:hypothetical protein
MEKIKEYDEKKRCHYLENAWVNGAESAEKVANIRERLIEAAKTKPGYQEKFERRKEKRKSTKEERKKAKRELATEDAALPGRMLHSAESSRHHLDISHYYNI